MYSWLQLFLIDCYMVHLENVATWLFECNEAHTGAQEYNYFSDDTITQDTWGQSCGCNLIALGTISNK